jgi:hypothetical protein
MFLTLHNRRMFSAIEALIFFPTIGQRFQLNYISFRCWLLADLNEIRNQRMSAAGFSSIFPTCWSTIYPCGNSCERNNALSIDLYL